MNACGCDGHGLMPVERAIETLLAQVGAPLPVERVPLAEALGRVLAEPVAAPFDVPAWDNSAMDGYAVRAAEVPVEGGFLPLAGRVAAGDTRPARLAEGQALRIFTGAPLPAGADSVVAQEDCRAENGGVWLPAVRAGQHVRRQGEELRAGSAVLAAGIRLRAQELGLLASFGLAEVVVYRRLRVGLLSSGDELREPGEQLLPGQIYDANRFTLQALLVGWGCELRLYPRMADRLDATRDTLGQAGAECDLLISSGGVSVGEEDHLKQAIAELGELDLWRLAIQPGKPLAFGRVGATPWLGLPGNPVAALITALVVARPYLLRAQGCARVLPEPVRLPAGFAWRKANGRRQYLRARLEQGRVVLHPLQGSAMLAGACWADGLAVVECGRTLGESETVDFLPFALLSA